MALAVGAPLSTADAPSQRPGPHIVQAPFPTSNSGLPPLIAQATWRPLISVSGAMHLPVCFASLLKLVPALSVRQTSVCSC